MRQSLCNEKSGIKLARVNFSPKTKQLVAERAGLQCSYPTCNRRTLGPGAEVDETSNSGTAAHIYSAAAGGPRGQGGLTEEELKHPDNAIWFCRVHGTLIDNNRGDQFPPQLLLSYKQLHEARIAREHQGLYSPLGWFHSTRIRKSPIFKSNESFILAKLNLIIGNNGTGKSGLCEWMGGLFDISFLERWRAPASSLDYDLTFFVPREVEVGLELTNNDSILYRVDGKRAPVNPFKINLIFPRRESRRLIPEEENDDLLHVAGVLKIDPSVVESVVEEIHNFRHAKIGNIHFKSKDNTRIMYLDVDGTTPGLSFGALSGREQERVFIEFSSALARYCGRYAPTLLLLDGFVSIFFDGWFDYYSHHFLDPDNQFQTILTIPTQDIDLKKVRWNGWQVLRTSGHPPECMIEQEL